MFTTFLTQDLDFADLRHFRGKEAASQWESRELSQTSRHQGSKRAPVESVRAFDGDPWRECVGGAHRGDDVGLGVGGNCREVRGKRRRVMDCKRLLYSWGFLCRGTAFFSKNRLVMTTDCLGA